MICDMHNDTSGNYTASDGTAINVPDDVMIVVEAGKFKNRLEWIMFRLGQYGFDVMIRYDTLREDNNFTVQVGKYPRHDTNDPLSFLLEILHKKEGV